MTEPDALHWGEGGRVFMSVTRQGKSCLAEAFERAPCLLEMTVSGDEQNLADWSASTADQMLAFLCGEAAEGGSPAQVLDVEQGESGLRVVTLVPAPYRAAFLDRMAGTYPLLTFAVVDRGRALFSR